MPRGESADQREERHSAVRSQPRERDLVQLVHSLRRLRGRMTLRKLTNHQILLAAQAEPEFFDRDSKVIVLGARLMARARSAMPRNGKELGSELCGTTTAPTDMPLNRG